MSIISMGLGGSATDMIINRFSLGGFDIEVVIPDVPERPSTGQMGVWIPRKKETREIIFVIRYKGKVWYKRYLWKNNFINAYIRVTKMINKIISNIKFTVHKVRSVFNSFRIKR